MGKNKPAGKNQPAGAVDGRILWNRRPQDARDCGDIDEIVVNDCTIHVEQMNPRCWWIGVYLADGSRWSGNFSCDSRGRMTFGEQDSEFNWPDDRSHENVR